jgi:hypothetical protein
MTEYSPTRIFFTYLGAGIIVGSAAMLTAETLAPEVAEDVKRGLFRRLRDSIRPPWRNESV